MPSRQSGQRRSKTLPTSSTGRTLRSGVRTWTICVHVVTDRSCRACPSGLRRRPLRDSSPLEPQAADRRGGPVAITRPSGSVTESWRVGPRVTSHPSWWRRVWCRAHTGSRLERSALPPWRHHTTWCSFQRSKAAEHPGTDGSDALRACGDVSEVQGGKRPRGLRQGSSRRPLRCVRPLSFGIEHVTGVRSIGPTSRFDVRGRRRRCRPATPLDRSSRTRHDAPLVHG